MNYDPSARFQPGYVFARRYVIEKKIGKGGMGTVFKALDQLLEIPVALKIINADISTDVKVLARLKREVILARKVGHPNVCRLYDIGESEGTHYVSMEFVDGMTLSELLVARGKLPVDEGLRILREVLQALQEAHRAGVIHRDLKPQNIMVDVNNRAFIMDFGISFSAEQERLTKTGMMIGTPRYMAPELFGQSANADVRADLYAMGVIFYEVFTGKLPFDADTPVAVMYAHLNQPPTPPTQRAPGIPLKLETLILKALEKDPETRFQTAGDFLAAVEGALHVEKSAPSVPTAQLAPTMLMPQMPRLEEDSQVSFPELPPERRSPVVPVLLSLIAVIGLAALGYYFIRMRPNPAQIPAPVTNASPAAILPESTPAPKTESVAPQPEQHVPEPQSAAVTEPVVPQSSSIGETNSANSTVPEPATVTPDAGTPAGTLGKIEYNGEYPILIFAGGKTILDSTKGTSAELPAGQYKLIIVGASSEAIIRQNIVAEVKPGETSVIDQPPMAKLDMIASSGSCKIAIDMVFEQLPPVTDLPIQAGNHTIKITCEELGKEKLAFFTVSPDQHIKLRIAVDDSGINIFEQKPQ